MRRGAGRSAHIVVCWEQRVGGQIPQVHQTSFAVPFLPLIKQDCCPHGIHTAEDWLRSANPEDLGNISSPPSTAPNSAAPVQAQVRKHLIPSAVCSLLNNQA